MMISLKSFGELVMRHRGERICVMGGGPSLASDIAQVEADVWISTNDHGARLREVDYVFAMDNLHTKLRVPMEGLIRPHTAAPIIGPWHWCDYALTHYPLVPKLVFSGVVAVWAAHLMGAHPVILAGFDCSGDAARSIPQHRAYTKHIQGAVRVVSGPLVDLWAPYDPLEDFGKYDPPEVFGDVMQNGVCVRVRKPVEIRGHVYPIGTLLRLPMAEVWRQIKHRSLIEVAEEPAPITKSTRKSRKSTTPLQLAAA